MGVVCTETIEASAARVWDLVSDIDGSADRISAISSIEVLHRPENGSMLGLKWRETRVMFGRQTVETMCISAIEPGKWYETHAQSCGSAYTSRISVAHLADAASTTSQISFSFVGHPLTWWARILSVIFTPVMTLSIRGAIAQDLKDIKTAAEK